MLIVLKIFQIWETERRGDRKRRQEAEEEKRQEGNQCEEGDHQSARLMHADTQRQALNCTNGSS